MNTWADEAQHAAAGGALDDAFDRPWLVIDPNTSALYLSLSDDALVERVVFASHDHGATWRGPFVVDPNEQSTGGDVLSAANGVLADGYIVDPSSKGYQAAASPAVTCSQVCAVFETSPETSTEPNTNDGQAWTRHVIPAPTVASGSGVEVAADPTTAGHYAVLVPVTASSDQIWVTTDSGTTWARTHTINAPARETITKPWTTYGSTGALAVVWRSLHSDSTYDVSAIVSTDGGSTFGSPVLLTPGTAPKDPPPQGTPGDDCACNMFLNGKYLYTTWGDSRTGTLQVWFARYRYRSDP